MSATAAWQIARVADLLGSCEHGNQSEFTLSGITFPSAQRTNTPGCESCRPFLACLAASQLWLSR